MKMYIVSRNFQKQGKWGDEKPDSLDIKLPVTLTNVMSITPTDVAEAIEWVKANKADEIKQDVKYSYFEMFWEADCGKDDIAKLEEYIAAEHPCSVYDVLSRLSGLQDIVGSFEENVELC